MAYMKTAFYPLKPTSDHKRMAHRYLYVQPQRQPQGVKMKDPGNEVAPKGMVLSAVLVINRVSVWPFLVLNRVWQAWVWFLLSSLELGMIFRSS